MSQAPVIVDFESRSRCDLKKRGGRLYWQDPSTEALCAVLYDTGTGEVSTWAPGDPPPRIAIAAAHNAHGFDKFAAQACGWEVGAWQDTSQMARRAGLPGALDKLAQMWIGREKDKIGSKLTVGLSRVSRAKKTYGQLPEVTPEIRARVLAYCADDVEVLAETWDRLTPWADVDADVCEADAAVNERGICLDADLVRALQNELARQQDVAVTAAAKAGGTSEADARANAQSPAKLKALTSLPNAQAATLSDPLHLRGLDTAQLALVKARRALASVVPGKLTACLLRASPDGRIRDWGAYYGAHTGRWSSRGIQLHNLPRVGFEDAAKAIGWSVNDYLEALCEGALAGGELTQREVSGLLRAVFVAKDGCVLPTLDYSGIEARALVWAAGDQPALDVFAALDAGTGPDPYCVQAMKLFGRTITKHDKGERNVGKQAELMLGYGAGAGKFDDTCVKAGTNLADFGLTAQGVVDNYRKVSHPQIVQLWRECEKAFAAACEGREQHAGPWTYAPIGDSVACVLPGGRPIVYPKAKANRGMRGWELSYQGRKAWREKVYGGLLTENAVQATCRDLLGDALVRCERDGLDPVLHVHDELVCEVPEAIGAEGLEAMREIMTDAPDWADGLPIKLDGFVSRRYRK